MYIIYTVVYDLDIVLSSNLKIVNKSVVQLLIFERESNAKYIHVLQLSLPSTDCKVNNVYMNVKITIVCFQ